MNVSAGHWWGCFVKEIRAIPTGFLLGKLQSELQKRSQSAWWVSAGHFVPEITMNSQSTHWVIVGLPPVIIVYTINVRLCSDNCAICLWDYCTTLIIHMIVINKFHFRLFYSSEHQSPYSSVPAFLPPPSISIIVSPPQKCTDRSV